jgi:serine-type D-Ala-D-Ala carboxypeptidase
MGLLTESEFPLTWAVLRDGLVQGVAPGFVAGLWQMDKPDRLLVAALGHRRIVPSKLPMEDSTVFDLASVSKVFATATLAALCVDRGVIRWDTSLQSLLPGYRDPDVQLAHLLSHTAGFPAWSPLWVHLRSMFAPRPLHTISVEDRQREMLNLVLAVEREAVPGERVLYSDISFLLLGFALERALTMPLDQAVGELVWKPMGINGAFYRRVDRDVYSGRLESVAATEECPWRGGILQGQVHDDNCWAMGGFGGHAGAFATADDLLRFSARLVGGFLSRQTLQAAWSRTSRPAGCDRTLGWDTPSPVGSSAGKAFSARSVGHLGYTGTSLWIDPEAGPAAVLLSNRVHPTRDNIRIRALRPRFHDALRADLRQH